MTKVTYNKYGKRCASFYETLSRDREECVFCDVKIEVEGTVFDAHKCVLIASTSYFYAMLSGSYEENEKGYVQLKDINKKAFEFVMNFMYGECLDLENKSLQEIMEAIDLADMLCLDLFIQECKEFVSDWRSKSEDGMLSICYALAKKLELPEMVEQMETIVYKKLLPVSHRDQLNIDFKHVSPDLMFAALRAYDNVIGLLSVAEMNTVSISQVKFKQVITYLTLQPELDYESVKEFLSLAKPEMLPTTLFEQTMEEILPPVTTVYYERLGLAIDETLTEIHRNIASEIKVTTILKKNGLSFKLAEYDKTVLDWIELSYFVGFKLEHFFVNEDKLYLVGPNCYGYYDTKKRLMSEIKKLSLEEEKFEISCVFVSNNILYLLGRHSDSNNVSIGIYNMDSDDLSRRELNQICQGNMTMIVRCGVVYYLNGQSCFSYDTQQCVLKAMNALLYNFASSSSSKLAVDSDYLFVIQKDGFYRLDLKAHGNPEQMKMISDTKDRLEILGVSSVPDKIVVACNLHGYTDEMKLFRYRKEDSTFVPLGFLKEQKMIGKPNVTYLMDIVG